MTFNLPKFCHLQTLTGNELPHLIERRQAVYAAMKCDIDAKEYARLVDMMMWLTEQIVYLKSKGK